MKIDTHHLAVQALEEVALLGSDGSGVRPIPDSPEGKLARLKELEPVPPLLALETVLREVFWASLATDEGRPCRMRLGYKLGDKCRSGTEQRLEQPVPLDRRTLRKFAALHDNRYGSIVWEESAGPTGVDIIGFDGARSGWEPHRLPGRFAVTARAPGALKVSWAHHVLVNMSMGSTIRLSQCALRLNANALGGFVAGDLRPVASVLLAEIREVAASLHGGAIWLVPSGATVQDIRGVRTDTAIAGSREQYGGRHPAEAIALVAKLASADGAVLVDANLVVVAFGAFFVAEIPDISVRWLQADGSYEDRRVPSLGGTRHRSTAGFCVLNRPAAGIVVSQDAQITVLVADRDGDDLRGAPVAEVGQDL